MNIAEGNCLHFYGFMGQDDKKRVFATDAMCHFALFVAFVKNGTTTITKSHIRSLFITNLILIKDILCYHACAVWTMSTSISKDLFYN